MGVHGLRPSQCPPEHPHSSVSMGGPQGPGGRGAAVTGPDEVSGGVTGWRAGGASSGHRPHPPFPATASPTPSAPRL